MQRTLSIQLSILIAGLMLSWTVAADVAVPYSSSAYAEGVGTKGVVLISANWSRKWKCGRFENAQLKGLSFDKAGSQKEGNDAKADIVLEDSSLFSAPPRFVNYAYIVEAGEYLLSAFSVKAAQSSSNVGYFNAARNDLIKDGKSKAGSFTVSAGEIVYVGHFFLDCAQDPMPWRYYPSDKGDFNQFLSGIKKEFDALDIEKVKFRLFDTTTMGSPFTLQ
ncbi:hypothetical protein ACLIKD_18700 [Azonexus sp. IMCC34842]|uniref:hypothetical protein n=1 Tax=Azonexus sp. IMCC34842 TaxID=3420950 RepID=UPI003D11D956